MKGIKKILCMTLSLLIVFSAAQLLNAGAENMFSRSDFTETEQPEISEETKRLIALYQSDSSEENLLKLRNEVISNYNAVLERKEAKLSELRVETEGKVGGEEIVAEMEEIVQDMYVTYWDRIGSTILRFSDPRLLKWRVADASNYEYIPVMGAGESIYIKRTPVTNSEYKAYIDETGYDAPLGWEDGEYPNGEDDYPVNFVSYYDAVSYCEYLSEKDGENTYRLPTESEWELAAGHMPKDADFNCGINGGRTPVTEYASVTRGAHGAVDFWGNVWEWTSEEREYSLFGVKGGSYKSERTECRTEYRKEARSAGGAYDDVGFRVIMVKDKKEPGSGVNITALDAPSATAVSNTPESITLSWNSVEGAKEYQVFEYFENTGFVKMLERTGGTSFTVDSLEKGKSYSYIVQAVGYTSISDNVSEGYCVTAVCGENKNDRLSEIRKEFKGDTSEDIKLVLSELSEAKKAVGDDSIDILINGRFSDSEDYDGAGPVIVNGRTLVPLRFIAEKFGLTVEWDAESRTVIISED